MLINEFSRNEYTFAAVEISGKSRNRHRWVRRLKAALMVATPEKVAKLRNNYARPSLSTNPNFSRQAGWLFYSHWLVPMTLSPKITQFSIPSRQFPSPRSVFVRYGAIWPIPTCLFRDPSVGAYDFLHLHFGCFPLSFAPPFKKVGVPQYRFIIIICILNLVYFLKRGSVPPQCTLGPTVLRGPCSSAFVHPLRLFSSSRFLGKTRAALAVKIPYKF
jgi:hypothetical protein